MGRTVDLPIHEWLICMANLGKFTVRPMDPMGDGSRWFFLQYISYQKIRSCIIPKVKVKNLEKITDGDIRTKRLFASTEFFGGKCALPHF